MLEIDGDVLDIAAAWDVLEPEGWLGVDRMLDVLEAGPLLKPDVLVLWKGILKFPAGDALLGRRGDANFCELKSKRSGVITLALESK